MITAQELEASGYRHHEKHDEHGWNRGLWQRRILDSEGRTRYFINFEIWAFPRDVLKERASVTVQLYADPDLTFDLARHINDGDTVGDVETFYHLAWERLGCCTDRHNND